MRNWYLNMKITFSNDMNAFLYDCLKSGMISPERLRMYCTVIKLLILMLKTTVSTQHAVPAFQSVQCNNSAILWDVALLLRPSSFPSLLVYELQTHNVHFFPVFVSFITVSIGWFNSLLQRYSNSRGLLRFYSSDRNSC